MFPRPAASENGAGVAPADLSASKGLYRGARLMNNFMGVSGFPHMPAPPIRFPRGSAGTRENQKHVAVKIAVMELQTSLIG